MTISSGQSIRVGRASTCALSIVDPGISRQHFEVLCGDQHCVLRDLGSSNGTELNGRRVTSDTRLRDGDRIVAGSSTLLVSIARDE